MGFQGMKKLLVMVSILCCSIVLSSGAGFPVFIGDPNSYLTNTGTGVRFYNGNILTWSTKASNGDISFATKTIFQTNLFFTTTTRNRILAIDADGYLTNAQWNAISPDGYGLFAYTNAGALILEQTNRTAGSTSATAAILDFASNDNTLEITNLAANITIHGSNWVHGRDKWVYIRTDGSERTVTFTTNGITGPMRISWGLTSTTNGNFDVTVTNRARFNLACVPIGEIAAAYEYQQ
jgi:hypothetical protein